MEPEKDDFKIWAGRDEEDADVPDPGLTVFVFAAAFLALTLVLAVL